MTKLGRSRWDFLPAPKPNAWSARVVPVEETDRRLSAVLRSIPVTRVSDLTPLDYLRLPVYSAVTPLARDLTTHLGKGNDQISAKVSALMEAVERVSAETIPATATLRSSLDELRASRAVAADPSHFDLPADTSYTASGSFSWIEGFDLARGYDVLLPTDLVANP